MDKAFLLLVRDFSPHSNEVIPLLLPAFLPEEASTEAIATFSPSPLVFTSPLVDSMQAYKEGGEPIANRSSPQLCRGLQDDQYRIPPLTNIR